MSPTRIGPANVHHGQICGAVLCNPVSSSFVSFQTVSIAFDILNGSIGSSVSFCSEKARVEATTSRPTHLVYRKQLKLSGNRRGRRRQDRRKWPDMFVHGGRWQGRSPLPDPPAAIVVTISVVGHIKEALMRRGGGAVVGAVVPSTQALADRGP